jgi:hypothetical protein
MPLFCLGALGASRVSFDPSSRNDVRWGGTYPHAGPSCTFRLQNSAARYRTGGSGSLSRYGGTTTWASLRVVEFVFPTVARKLETDFGIRIGLFVIEATV